MQANLNLNSNTTGFPNPFNTVNKNSFFSKPNQKVQTGTTHILQSNPFNFNNTTPQNSKQSNLQNFGIGIKQAPKGIFTNTTPNTNIMNAGFKANQGIKINQPNIAWQQLKITKPVKPINNKITDALVKTVNCTENLSQYSLTQIRCKIYWQKLQSEQNNYQAQNQGNPFYNAYANGFSQTPSFTQPQNNFQNNSSFSIPSQASNQNVNEFNNMIYGYLSNLVLNQSMFPLLTSFLEDLGITPDILEFLMRMELSQQEIKQFINRRLLLKNIQKQRVQRHKLMLQHPTLFPSNTDHSTQIQQSGSLFSRLQANYRENIGYNRFIDFIIFKEQFKWEAQLIEECQKQYLKDHIVQNQQKQNAIKRLLDELQNIGLAREVELQRQQRKKRINNLYLGAAAAFNHEQKQIRISQVIETFGFPKNITIKPKTYYYEPSK